MKKITLCISMFFMLISLSSIQAVAPVAATTFAGGDGTINDPFQISTFEELYFFSSYASATKEYFALTANIDATASGEITTGYPTTAEFGGIFDGNGFTISNLKMEADAAGDFGFISGSKNTAMIIQDLHFVNLTVINKKSARLAGVVGDMERGGKILRCSITGTSVITGNVNFGGIVGFLKSTTAIEDCFVQAEIKNGTNKTKNFGGIVGGVGGGSPTVKRCLFVGTANEPICRNTPENGTFEDCFCDTTNSTLFTNITSFVGQTRINDVKAKQQATYTNFDFATVWEIEEGLSYPVLRTPTYAVAFDCNPSYGTITGVTPGTYAAGTVFTATATPNNGAIFDGWYINNTLVSTDAEFTHTTSMGDVSLYAHFTTSSTIQDLYYYNGFNSVNELVVTAKNAYSSNWSGYQGGSTDGGTFEIIGGQTYNKIHWNTDVLYYGGTDRADVQMEMAFQTTSENPGLDFLLRATNTGNGSVDRKTAINVQLVTKYTTEDSIVVKLNDNGAPALMTAATGINITNDGTEYKFMVRLVGNQLSAWVAEANNDYSDAPQLDYTITDAEGFQASGVYGFGVTDGESAAINYFAAGAPSSSIPTSIDKADDTTLRIYPNPTNNYFTVATSDAVNVSVIDLSGKTVIAPLMVNGRTDISVRSLRSGLYFVKAGTSITKLIVE